MPDVYFSKATFVNDATRMGFHVISCLRDDASLRYLTTQLPSGGRGRPQQFDGKIDIGNPDESRFEIIGLNNAQGRILSAVVNSVSLKRNMRLCIWQSADEKGTKLHFTTDIQRKEQNLNDNFGISKLVVCIDCALFSYENRENNNVRERAFCPISKELLEKDV